MRLTLELAQHQPSLVDAWLGPAQWRPGPRRPVAEIRDRIVGLDAALAALPPSPESGERHQYLRHQVSALLVAARRSGGESMRFFDEAEASLGIRSGEAATDELAVAAARQDLEKRLAGAGTLADRYAALRRRQAVAPDRMLATWRAALDWCGDRVGRRLTLPDSEQVELEAARDLGFEARALYEGNNRTRVAIDASGATDVARLVWLAAHETYPGHHVQHVLADRDCVRTKGWIERALHPAFGRHLLCAEGAAEAGAALLLEGPAFEEACQSVAPVAGTAAGALPDLVAVHRAVTTLDSTIPGIARAYVDGEIAGDEATRQLGADALVTSPNLLLLLIERRRSRVLGYPVGRRLVAASVVGAPPSERWRRLARIATTLTLPAAP